MSKEAQLSSFTDIVEELSPLGLFYRARLLRAWKLFEDGEFEQANALAQEMLLEPALGPFHRASFHLILGHSPYEPLAHARAARKIFDEIFPNPDDASLSSSSRKVQKHYKAYALNLTNTAAAAEVAARKANMALEEEGYDLSVEGQIKLLVDEVCRAEDEMAERAAHEPTDEEIAEQALLCGTADQIAAMTSPNKDKIEQEDPVLAHAADGIKKMDISQSASDQDGDLSMSPLLPKVVPVKTPPTADIPQLPSPRSSPEDGQKGA